MKRHLSALFISFTLLAGTVAVMNLGAPIAHAQGATTGSVAPAVPVNNAASTAVPAQFGTIMTWIMSLFAWLVGAAALVLDWSVFYTVVTMGNYVSHLTAVGVTWRIFRDLGNIVLIFGFLAVGITTILNVNWYGGPRTLVTLLIVAVFLNFSLFISEAVIDVGNIFATQFYTQINGGVVPTQTTLSNVTIGTFGTGNLGNEGISNKIMAQLGLQTAYGGFNTNTAVAQGANPWLIGFMGSILFLITAFVMFSLAFILIARFVILILLIIVAPIGFAGLVVPKLENLAKQWWSALFNQTITAPILLLLLYVALAVITDAQFLTGICTGTGTGTCTKNWLGFVSGNNFAGFASMMLSFFIAMGLLLAVVIVSKKMSEFGGGVATKAAGAFSFGLIARGARQTIGRTSRYASKKVRESRFGASQTGRLFATTLDRGAKASFDVRGTKMFNNIPFGGVGAGAAAKGGFDSQVEARAAKHKKYADSLGRDLTGEEKQRKDEIEKQSKLLEEEQKNRQSSRNELAAAGKDVRHIDEEIARNAEFLSKYKADLEKLSVTSKELKLKYATTLTFGKKEDGQFINENEFNQAFNPAGTEAAKKIIKSTLKSKDEKLLDDMKAVAKEGLVETEKTKPEEAKP
ncbi:hypothetical protein HKL94_00250 [Candidatus Parcubacteria bacterium]|nr:hypothetical protein [Candidatus Parcubacteria bacterium]